MMGTTVSLILPHFWILFVLFAGCNKLVSAVGDHPWCYNEDKCGPSHWSGICKTGHSQSPIDINPGNTTLAKHLSKIRVNKEYLEAHPEFWIKNNGHTIQVQLREDMTSALKMDGDGFRGGSYQFSQAHFHWGDADDVGSEHTIGGHSYVMELHLVHFSNNYESILAALTDQNSRSLAVLGIFFQLAKNDNPALNPIVDALGIVESYHPDASTVKTSPLNFSAFFPDVLDTFRYEGSLTTPSCAEKVVWTVFRNPVPISRRQLDAFRHVKDNADMILVNNFRPTQPLSRRKVMFGTLHLSELVNENMDVHEVTGPDHGSDGSTHQESGETGMNDVLKPTKNIEGHEEESHDRNHTSSEVEHRSKSYRPTAAPTIPVFFLAWCLHRLFAV